MVMLGFLGILTNELITGQGLIRALFQPQPRRLATQQGFGRSIGRQSPGLALMLMYNI